MTTIQVVPEAERRAAWLEKRRGLITATDAAKILGVSPWGTAIDVYCEKKGIDTPRPETKEMRRGKRRERLVLDAYADEEEIPLNFADPFDVIVCPTIPWLGCTLDARRSDNGIPVEAKTARWATPEWGPHDSDVFPLHYGVQLAIQMVVLGAEVAHLPAEFAGDEYRRYFLRRNLTTETAMIDKLAAFREKHLLGTDAPAPDGSEGYREYIKQLYPKSRDVVLEASDMQNTRGHELTEVRKQLALLEMEKGRLEDAFKLELKDAAELHGDDWYILWRKNKDSVKVAWKEMAALLSEKVRFLSGVFAEPKRIALYHDDPKAAAALVADMAEFLKKLEAAHTTTSMGARPFNFKLRGEK